jgi:hypothetical protein
MDEFVCHYCNRNFSCKTALSKHKFGSCLWLHTSKREKLHEIDSFEPLMNENQKDALIRTLFLQVVKMRDDITNMRRDISQLKQKQKMTILHSLNSSTKKPSCSIQSWVKDLTITQRHLEIVFQKSMKEAILQVFIDELEAMKLFQKLVPMKGYNQRVKTLYVYCSSHTNVADPDTNEITTTTTIQWVKLELELFKTLCSNLAARFYDLYLDWQHDNEEYLNSSSNAQEQDIMFMQKMLDEAYKTNIQMNHIIENIYETIKTPFETIEYE